MTVLENLLLGAPPWRGERLRAAFVGRAALAADGGARRWRRRAELLARLDLAPQADSYAGELSGGQKRLVEIGRAMMASRGCCCWTSRWPG